MLALGAGARVRRQASGVLVVEKSRIVAFFRLLLALAFVVIFYHVLLRLGDMPEHGSLTAHLKARLDATWLNAVLLFLPAVVIPEVIASFRVLARGASLRFDADTRVIERNRQPVATFANVRHVELTSVNGSCEEMALSLLLHDGRHIEVDAASASDRTGALAEELAGLLDAPLVRH